MLHEIVWDKPFDIVYGIVTIPRNSVFYRGHSTKHDTISERPAYFSSKTLAQSYVRNSEYKLSAFKATRPLRLLDVRFMMSMLRDLFNSNPKKMVNVSVILSFGLCSLRHQVHLLNKRYTDINEGHKHLQEIVGKLDPTSNLEEQGVRIGETWNDAETMAFLKHLFNGFVDGYISPRLHTPYHVSNGGTLLPEMIIFNPKKSDIIEMIDSSSDIYPVSIQTICELQAKQFSIKSDSDSKMAFYLSKMVGGGDNVYIPTVEQINEKWDEPTIQTRIQNGYLSAQSWKEHFIFDKFEFKTAAAAAAAAADADAAPAEIKTYPMKLEDTHETETETTYNTINHPPAPAPPAPMVPITPWPVAEQRMKERMKEVKKHTTRKLRKNDKMTQKIDRF